jgi:uncharacterized protein YndB with AHSA1/START domain
MTGTVEASVATQVYRVYIKATPQAIWDAITQPDWTDRYGYGGFIRYDGAIRPGTTFRHLSNEAMQSMGAPEVMVDGEVIEADPPRKLVQTWRMVMDEGLCAEGFTRVTYEIAEMKDGVSRLTLTHELEGKPKLAFLVSGGAEEQGAGGGWSWVLSDLKTVLESGQRMAG